MPDGTSIGVGWIDIGDIDFILCFDEKILNIPFEAVSGLDSEGNTMTFLIDERYKEFGDHPNQSLIIKLSRKPTSKMTTQIFSRVSRGESQPHISDGDEYEVDENIKVNPPEKIVPNETAPIISPHHSSTAMAVPKNISQNASNITQSNMQLNAKPNINTNVDTNQGNQPNEKQQTKVINFGNLGNDNGNPATKMMKSSIAMYYNFDAQPKSQSSQLDECLFTDESATMATESTEAVKSSIPDPESTEANSTIANDNEFDSIASPPPPSIAIDLRTDPQNEPENENENDTEIENEEPESVKVVEKEKETKVVKGLRQIQKKTTTSPPKKETKSKKISKFESEQDEIISRHTERVSEKITAGIDALTKQRMDSIDNFEGQIARYVDSFKDDIKTTLQDREHGSINQIEASKQKFQNNIQQFKKKEGLMHQTLTGIEEENKQMSSKITGIQRTMRDKTQQLRLDLENELKNLRKKVRRKDTIRDNSDDFDEDFLDDLPKLKSRYITA
ncbi:hypothetical protein TRFO_03483 [Tritrichomonas foetus]|uniref:Uncharacterized protein n=1 Tax=Tritrichomonas foetus TaxID=1144522 RepID=A0A1J4KP99_9EUKA|nr:hypothetical protein TRFO_03483 [Tritrichomonas foetus]|eukprot:OHT13059.1 hypothetical protein TRFO_03483 [Tritrichomonas foetus]